MTARRLIIIAAIAFGEAAPVHSAEREGRKKAAEGGRVCRWLHGNLEGLYLTDEQKDKLETFQQEQRGKMQELRDASPDERREKFQKLQAETTDEMKEMLAHE